MSIHVCVECLVVSPFIHSHQKGPVLLLFFFFISFLSWGGEVLCSLAIRVNYSDTCHEEGEKVEGRHIDWGGSNTQGVHYSLKARIMCVHASY